MVLIIRIISGFPELDVNACVNNDWLRRFLSECCELDSCYKEKSGEIYKEYRRYCGDTGEFVRSTTDFYGALDQAGFERKMTNKDMLVRGLMLKADDFLDC